MVNITASSVSDRPTENLYYPFPVLRAMRLAVLFSSGKDSTFTIHYYLEQGWDVACLLTLLPKNEDSYMFQAPLRELVEAQAEALGLPVIFQETEGVEEEELEELKLLLGRAKEGYGVEGVAVGALASDYQHVRVNHACHALGLKTYAPLWHKDQLQLLRELIDAGYDLRMTRIAAMGLNERWLGRRLTEKELDELGKLRDSFGFHPGGEGGEYETIVLDGPLFKKRLEIEYTTRMESAERGELVITAVRLAEN